MTPLSRILSLCIVGLGLGFGFLWFADDARTDATKTKQPTSAPVAPPEPASAPAVAPPPPRLETSDANPDVTPDAAPLLSDEARARLFAEIEAAYTTYEVAALPKLAPRLRHSSPEIRAFARDAIVQLGHAEGAAVLRAASREIQDPREATALLDAAEFLELPPVAPINADTLSAGAGRAAASGRSAAAPAASAPPY